MMKCPICEKEGKLSYVTAGTTTSTLLAYFPVYDELGRAKPCSDPNIYTTQYRCSNGHEFTNHDLNKSDSTLNAVQIEKDIKNRSHEREIFNKLIDLNIDLINTFHLLHEEGTNAKINDIIKKVAIIDNFLWDNKLMKEE